MSADKGLEHHTHEVEELCETGALLYACALREGRVRQQDAEESPCLLDFGLLHPDPEDSRWLRPTAPAVALPRLLRTFDEEVARQHRRAAKLTETFEPLMDLKAQGAQSSGSALVTALQGFPRINAAINQAVAESSQEMLTIQPGGNRSPEILATALPREQALLSRGARMRTLYQHTSRYSSAVMAHYEQLDGDVEVRTLDEVTDRLIIIDRAVAFIPASPDRTIALQIRHPALVAHFATTFDRLWRLATPMYPQATQQSSVNGITPRQRAIAALLIEGHTDTVIAQRLGLNVRTARVHIAKLAATLGSESRAQLGYLIGQSGILEQSDQER
ncbi:helix-turn-helix transcriptional regulator [Streptomyces albicerus]|uniref:helix-turn-helix transcriptional regulator n=1 Tax=Streptomyces albicerus TaxID=2569859 RepID=UPI00124AF79F|nr:LuxR C-terminal-related transcriptional regulator [Streptomyces albicerus]